MGSDTITARSNGQTIDETWFNIIRSALAGDQFPRNTNGVTESLAGSLGSSTYKFLKMFVASGQWTCGDIKYHHTYNGLTGLEIDHGWMLCDGRVVGSATYDAEHGSGTWATYIITSPLDGKYLPNMVDRYLVGGSVTTQTGTSAFTTVGNVGHDKDISHTHNHTHTVNSHNHQWMQIQENYFSTIDRNAAWDTNGNTLQLPRYSADVTTATDPLILVSSGTGGALALLGNCWTNNDAPGTDADATASSVSTLDFQPESIVALPYMRII